MFHVKHPAALGAVAAHQEEVRAGSSSRFALRTLRPAPSSPAPARDPRTQRASAQYAPIHLRKHSLASFRVARLEPISRTPLQLFRLRGRLVWRDRCYGCWLDCEVEKVAEKLDFSTRAARAGGWQKDPCHPSTLHMKHPAVVAGGTRRRRDAPKRNAPPQDRRAIR